MSYDRALYQMYLAQIPMFAACSGEQLDLVARLGAAVTVAQGSDVVVEGDAGDGLYIVASGAADVLRNGEAVASLGLGDYFGELSLFDPAPRNATVRAAEPLSYVMLTPDAFAQALDEIPEIRDALLHGMATRIHELDQRI